MRAAGWLWRTVGCVTWGGEAAEQVRKRAASVAHMALAVLARSEEQVVEGGRVVAVVTDLELAACDCVAALAAGMLRSTGAHIRQAVATCAR